MNDVNGRADLQSSHSPPRSISNGKPELTSAPSAVTGTLYKPVIIMILIIIIISSHDITLTVLFLCVYDISKRKCADPISVQPFAELGIG